MYLEIPLKSTAWNIQTNMDTNTLSPGLLFKPCSVFTDLPCIGIDSLTLPGNLFSKGLLFRQNSPPNFRSKLELVPGFYNLLWISLYQVVCGLVCQQIWLHQRFGWCKFFRGCQDAVYKENKILLTCPKYSHLTQILKFLRKILQVLSIKVKLHCRFQKNMAWSDKQKV